MQDGDISQGVSRLKELLFEPESQALTDLRQRIETLSETDRRNHQDLIDRLSRLAAAAEDRQSELARRLTESDAAELRERQEISQRLDDLFERAGTEVRFRDSVAKVIDGALRQAEVERSQQLSQAVAPLVITTIRREIRNSEDELAEALYPHMGRMVKSYVATAMKDLADQINRKLAMNPVMLHMRSLTTGRSVAELAMAESAKLEVEELYLIRRGSGELVARWPETKGASNRDHALGGTLTAINEFAADAFRGEGSSLRQVDLGTAQIYLRASPRYLLAARCVGNAPAALEQVIDDTFLNTIEAYHDRLAAESEMPVETRATMLGELNTSLKQRVASKQEEMAVPPLGFAPLKWAAAIVILPLLAWFGWSTYQDFMTARTHAAVTQVVENIGDLKGYPVRIDVERGGRKVTVSGLAPTSATKAALKERVAIALPGVTLNEQLSVLPNSTVDAERRIAELQVNVSTLEGTVSGVGRDAKDAASAATTVRRDLSAMEAELSRAAIRRSLTRATSRLAQTLPDLKRLESELQSPADRGTAAGVSQRSERLLEEIRQRLAALATPATAEAAQPVDPAWQQSLGRSADDLAALIGQRRPAGTSAGPRAQVSPAEQAEDVAAAVERLSAISVAVLQANALRLSLPPPAAPAEITPRDRLAAYIRNHAVFFSNGSDYRDEGEMRATLDMVTKLMSETDVLLRVVGYTDERGGQQRNTSLSQARADRVLEDLASRGVPRQRLIAIGRLNSLDISPEVGAGSPNRRVEFEIGFIGERAATGSGPERRP